MIDKRDLDEIRERAPLVSIISRRVRLQRRGVDWFGCCPFHEEKSASFTVNEVKRFWHCFGCHRHGDVIEWFRLTDGLSFNDAVERARQEAGTAPMRAAHGDDQAQRDKQAKARRIWADSQPIDGTVAEIYLRHARGVRIPLPATLRFHPDLPHKPGLALGLPAMVAAVTNQARQVVAVQRTFLKPDGSGKAPLDAPKRSLGPIGQGAVRLAPPAAVLGLAEGVETGLSAMELYRLPVWCALGSNLAGIELPELVRHVILFADRGAAGELAAAKAEEAFRRQRRKVSVRYPDVGGDFNDELRSRRGMAA